MVVTCTAQIGGVPPGEWRSAGTVVKRNWLSSLYVLQHNIDLVDVYATSGRDYGVAGFCERFATRLKALAHLDMARKYFSEAIQDTRMRG